MTNHPNRSQTVSRRFKLPGGLDALAMWRRGSPEGEIYADATWMQNSPTGSIAARTAEGRASEVTGAGDDVEWNWQPKELLDMSPQL